MLRASIFNSIDEAWLGVTAIQIGRETATPCIPQRYVAVTRGEKPFVRVDIYSCGPDCFAFEQAIVWREFAIVGFGSHVHAVSLIDHSVVSIQLGSYFGHLYPEADFVLIASGECLFRLDSDRSIGWKSTPLGIDGVVVREIGPDVIRGDGEWDPPGGWKPFVVSVLNGTLAL